MKKEDTSTIQAIQRRRILQALLEHHLSSLELATDLEIESSELLKHLHTLCLQRLVKMVPISGPMKKRYAELHDVLMDVMAGKRPVKDLHDYDDCTPRAYMLTKAGKTALAHV